MLENTYDIFKRVKCNHFYRLYFEGSRIDVRFRFEFVFAFNPMHWAECSTCACVCVSGTVYPLLVPYIRYVEVTVLNHTTCTQLQLLRGSVQLNRERKHAPKIKSCKLEYISRHRLLDLVHKSDANGYGLSLISCAQNALKKRLNLCSRHFCAPGRTTCSTLGKFISSNSIDISSITNIHTRVHNSDFHFKASSNFRHSVWKSNFTLQTSKLKVNDSDANEEIHTHTHRKCRKKERTKKEETTGTVLS